MYRHAGINTIVFNPLDDFNERKYMEGLFQGTKTLFDLIHNQKKKVYVHCTSGITRGPTQAIVYLCLCIKDPNWKDCRKVKDQTIKPAHIAAIPNMKAAEQCIRENKKYQDEMFNLLDLDRRRIKDRIAELEREKKKVIGYHDGEEQRLYALLKRLDEDEAERLRRLAIPEPVTEGLEHYADGNVEIKYFTETEFDRKCDELFMQRPIPFVPQKGDNYQMEKELDKRIK